MPTIVVRFRSRLWRQAKPDQRAYVARPGKLGNPFVIGRDGTRAEVIEKFRAHFFSRPDLMAAAKGLKGKLLGCFCAPEPCHAQVLADYADTPDGYFIPVGSAVHHRLREYKLKAVASKELRSHMCRGRRFHSWALTLSCGHVTMRPARVATRPSHAEPDAKPPGFWRRAPSKVRCTACPLRD